MRREPRLPRSRWQRERRHSVQVPRAKTPAGLSLAARSEWTNQERGARDSWIGHQRKMNLRGLSTRAGRNGGNSTTGTGRRRRQRSKPEPPSGGGFGAGGRKVPVWASCGPPLTRSSGTLAQLAFRAGDAAEAGSGRAREGPLGAGGPHRPRGRRELSGCHERSRDSARSVVWRKEERAWEIERSAELRREREQQRQQPDRVRDRDYGPGR